MRNRYGNHRMITDEEKREFHKKYGRANFSKTGSKTLADMRIEIVELRKEIRKLVRETRDR